MSRFYDFLKRNKDALSWYGTFGAFMAVAVSTVLVATIKGRAKARENLIRSNIPITATVLEELHYKPTVVDIEWVRKFREKYRKDPPYKVTHTENGERMYILNPRYAMRLKTDDGRILTVYVQDRWNFKKESLDDEVDVGTKIRFPAGNLEENVEGFVSEIRGETYFKKGVSEGRKSVNRITVLE